MEVTGITVARAEAIEAALIVSAYIAPNGSLVFIQNDGNEFHAGYVVASTNVISGAIDGSGVLTLVKQDETEAIVGSVRDPDALVDVTTAGSDLVLHRRDGVTSNVALTTMEVVQLVYTATDVFDKADYPGLKRVDVEMWGGGGAGSNNGGGGGGGGAYVAFSRMESELASTENVVVGAGGVGAATPGSPGGASSFSGMSAGGGGGGNVSGDGQTSYGGGGGGLTITGNDATPTAPGNGGYTVAPDAHSSDGYAGGRGGTGGSVEQRGGRSAYGGGGGGAAWPLMLTGTPSGGISIFGGGGGAGGGGTGQIPAGPGTSVFGGNGGTGGLNTNAGGTGAIPGGGGGAGGFTGSGGSGARGEVRLTLWISSDS